VAEDLLERIRREIGERKQAARAACEESGRLERALEALGGETPGASGGSGGRSPRAQRRAGSRPRAVPGANRDAIVAAVSERPGATAGELAAATGIARATVASTLARLTTAGALERSEPPGGGVGFRPAPEPPAPSRSGQTAATKPPAATDGDAEQEKSPAPPGDPDVPSI